VAGMTRNQARHLLALEAFLAEQYGRRCELAMGNGDVEAARGWNRAYRASAARCRAFGALVRDERATAG